MTMYLRVMGTALCLSVLLTGCASPSTPQESSEASPDSVLTNTLISDWNLPWYYFGDAGCLLQGGQNEERNPDGVVTSVEQREELFEAFNKKNDTELSDFLNLDHRFERPDEPGLINLLFHIIDGMPLREDFSFYTWKEDQLLAANLTYAVRLIADRPSEIYIKPETVYVDWPLRYLFEQGDPSTTGEQARILRDREGRIRINDTLNTPDQPFVIAHEQLGAVDHLLDGIDLPPNARIDGNPPFREVFASCDQSDPQEEHRCIARLVNRFKRHYIRRDDRYRRDSIPFDYQYFRLNYEPDSLNTLATRLFYHSAGNYFELRIGLTPRDLTLDAETGSDLRVDRWPCGRLQFNLQQ